MSKTVKSTAIDQTNPIPITTVTDKEPAMTVPITTILSATTPVITTTVTEPSKTTNPSQNDRPVTTTKAPTTTPVPATTPSQLVTPPVPVTTPATPATSLQIGDNDNNADWGPLIPMVTTTVG